MVVRCRGKRQRRERGCCVGVSDKSPISDLKNGTENHRINNHHHIFHASPLEEGALAACRVSRRVCVCVPRRANRRLDGAGREWETLEREREDWRDDPPLVFEKEWTGGEGLPSSRSKGTLVPTAIHALADQANAHHRPRVACPSLSLFVFLWVSW